MGAGRGSFSILYLDNQDLFRTACNSGSVINSVINNPGNFAIRFKNPAVLLVKDRIFFINKIIA